jgi:hypothetical protein
LITEHLSLTLLTLHMEAGRHEDPFRRWAVDECAALLEALQALLRDSTGALDVAVLLGCGPTHDPFERAAMEAAVEAVRGAVHSLTPELAATARLNVIVFELGAGAGAVASALDYIASPGGAYVAGSTFDLRAPS